VQSRGFFRELDHYELLARSVLPELVRARGRGRLQLWSAGCSSGEDAWSLAMIVAEARLPPTLAVAIVASERDPRELARAIEAVYRDAEVEGVSAPRRRRHMVRGSGPRRGLWRVVASLRDQVELIELDLAGAWPERGAFDIVLCHEPIARLGGDAATRLAHRFVGVLAPGGVFLGAPALSGELAGAVRHGPGVYRKPMR
jgi:chemotaxis protein methyltransferase CheR